VLPTRPAQQQLATTQLLLLVLAVLGVVVLLRLVCWLLLGLT
jgi:hypothetical protein